VTETALRLAADLEQSPYASRLGLAVGDVMPDVVTASVPWSPGLANAQGFVHGGVAASLSMWSAMVLAVASDRGRALGAYPVSFSVHYLAAARGEALHASARLSSRGRDLVHVEIEVDSDKGRRVASAMAVLRTREVRTPAAARPLGAAAPAPAGGRLIPPFSPALGAELRAHDANSTSIAMPDASNLGPTDALDPGALLSLADICAALACLPSLEERSSGSATLSLAAVFGCPLVGPALAVGRQVAEDGGVRSALIRIDGDGAPPRSAHPALTACVAYRFVSAETGR
jgi:uncharacterized protein (TIGR00369 family)